MRYRGFIAVATAGLGALIVTALLLWSPPGLAVAQVPRPPTALDLALDTIITVSGTVTGPEGPVPDVWVLAYSESDGQATTTDAGGFYSLSLQVDGWVWFSVRPEVSTRLTQYNLGLRNVTGSFTQDFSVSHGHLLSLRVLDGEGEPVTGWMGFQVWPSMVDLPPDPWWYILWWDEVDRRHQAVLPPEIYLVRAENLPAGHYDTAQAYDLRVQDVAADLQLNTEPVHPFPYDPPDASRITIGPADDLGEAIVSGAPGAVEPLNHVLLVNLNSSHQGHTMSEADGSFAARVFAPPGSAILIKHGPIDRRWNGLSSGLSFYADAFSGTVINVPHSQSVASTLDSNAEHQLPFAAAGAIDWHHDESGTGFNYVGAAWSLTGTIGPAPSMGQWTRVLSGTYDGDLVPGLYLGGLNWAHPALGDLDGDADLDLLVGERSGHLVLYRNQGDPAAPDWVFDSADYGGIAIPNWWIYPALAGVTGDGVPDLFVGEETGTLSIYYSLGAPAGPPWGNVPDEVHSVGTHPAPALDDLDGDGDLDLVVGHDGGTLYLFENTGTAASPTWTMRTPNYGGIQEEGFLQPAFVDLDGDGDRDLLAGLCGPLIWYRRGGTPSSPTWTRVDEDPIGYGGGGCATSPAVGDLDEDGDTDVVIGEENWGTLRTFLNDGPPAWTERPYSFPFDLAGDSAPALADWDDDGDQDLLLGQQWGRIYQYTNVGSAAGADWRPDGILLTLPWTESPHPFPALADIDGDGACDLFIGEGGEQSPEGAGGNIHYYHNDGTPATPAWTLVTTRYLDIDVGGWSTPVFADIDADTDLDLFIGDEQGRLTFVQNTGTPTAPTWAAPLPGYAGLDLGEHSAPAFLDVDGDGDLDILAGSQNGSLAFVHNTGSASGPVWELIATEHPDIDIGERSTPAASDIDGDGQADLLIGDHDGGLNLFLGEQAAAGPAPEGSFSPGDLVRLQATLHLHSQAIDEGTDLNQISMDSRLLLMMLFDQQGRPLVPENYFMSTILTPTGLPIQRMERSLIEWPGFELEVENLRHAGGHMIEGDILAMGRVPEDLLAGIYRPVIHFDFGDVPTSTEWRAASFVWHNLLPIEAALAPITVGEVGSPRLVWRLLMDDYPQGTRGTGAREDAGLFGLASQIVTQGAPYHVPLVDSMTGDPVAYRLEPFLPMVSFNDRRMPDPPSIPFDLPGGQLCAEIRPPGGAIRDLGCEALAQSFVRSQSTRVGYEINPGTVRLDDVYSVKAGSDRFRAAFSEYGHHVITMTGTIDDLWGNTYSGGGTYDVWVTEPMDIDPGVLPATPLAAGDMFNPTLQFYPRVPAEVTLTVTHIPYSDPNLKQVHTLTGQANEYGYLGLDQPSIAFSDPGEYRVDLAATYSDEEGTQYMGAMTWGAVVFGPSLDLVAHGRRGLDSLHYIPSPWFVSSRDLLLPEGAVSHTLNPYYGGDILWSHLTDQTFGGDSLIMGASVHDLVGVFETAIRARAERVQPQTALPGSLEERFGAGEIPLFISTLSGRPAQFVLRQIGEAISPDVDQIAYSYRSSQRPGVRVRELVAEDSQSGGYWRLDTLYDDQLGVGVRGDLPNDFKFQYVGVVYRDLASGVSRYLAQGTSWVHIPEEDPLGSRVMPPFAGPGNGGWTTEGGPILTLKGEDIHIFILPTGTRPGAVLEVGDMFSFAGHIMPTLDSQVAVTVTAPGGARYVGGGQANSVGYYYHPGDDLVVDEAGSWTVDVRVWHDGQCSGGHTVPPYPAGDVLGSDDGRYWFYAVPQGAPRLHVISPLPGLLSFDEQVTPITITVALPPGLSNATLDYTISMPGYILQHGQGMPAGSTYQLVFDPQALHQDFPNLDLNGRHDCRPDIDLCPPGLSDTFSIALLLEGQIGGETVHRANALTLQGQQVFVAGPASGSGHEIYLPLVLRGG